jgi:hypothetical protein
MYTMYLLFCSVQLASRMLASVPHSAWDAIDQCPCEGDLQSLQEWSAD